MKHPEDSIQARRSVRIKQLLPIEFPADLPVVAKREELAKGIADNQVVIICGETGSGKTTQLPKICLSIGLGVEGMIAHTQPRRVATRSVASRIAYELKSELGSAVGYKIRFNDKVSSHTSIKLMTDGILLAELQGDPLLKKYDTVIIDEAHERSLNIDFLLGCLKQILPRRPDLKLIITSATLDAERFSRHFDNAPAFQVSGRSYPVEIRYRPPQENDEGEVEDMSQAICGALDEISVGGLNGDVLVFLSGEREIREAAEALRKHHPKGVETLPLYSRLSATEQDRVFKPTSGMRRVVLATNVAETSLTVPNIGYVIDTGLARVNRYSLRQKVEQLHIEKISQAAANQRAGRCGRVMNGICVRLYEESEFTQRPAYTDAEIFRVSLATVILRMAALRLGEVEQFPFLEAPGSRAIVDGYQLLAELGAIDEARKLTSLGSELARLPLDPRIARLLLAGKQHQCLSEILVIASALSLQDPRERPQDRREAADAAHQRFNDERSDFLTYLKIWAWFRHAVQHKKSNRQLALMCREHFLSPLRLREWHDLYQQLHAMMLEMSMLHHGSHEVAGGTVSQELYARIHKALLTGLLGNIGMKSVDSLQYLGARGIKFFIAPNSVLTKKGAKWVMAAELTETHKLYARCAARIEPQWLEEVGAHLIKRHYHDPHWEKKAAQVAAWERSTLYGLVINPKKRIHYGPINSEEAREVFIRQALVAGEFNTQAPFFAHNQKLIHDIEALEHKSRRPDVLVDDELIIAFYDSRIPHEFEGHGIHNGATFEHWRKQAERDNPELLFLKKDDLMRHEASGITTDQFPPQLEMNNVSYALAYHFAPGQKDDGVTLTAPQTLLNQASIARCEWLVPGLLEDKVARLLKTLPQKLRRHLVPLPEFAARFCAEVQPSDTPLLQALTRFIREQKQLDTPLDAFHLEQLPPHLAMNFRVIDEHGRQLGMSRNFAKLRMEWTSKASAAAPPSKAGTTEKPAAERHKSWDFGKFEETALQQRAGHTITVFNALGDEGDAVALQSYDTHEEALAVHRKGLTRLFMLSLKEQVNYLGKNLPDAQKLGMLFLPFGNQQDLQRQILAVTFERCCLMEPWPTNEREFAARASDAKSRLNLVGQEIARLVGSILAEYHALQKALPGFKTHGQAIQDIRQQLEWLLGKDWIARTPYERLHHLPRYLKAINVRLDKLRANQARDSQQLAQLLPLQQQWQRRLSGYANEPDTRLDDFGWLLQELRVSLFAQELKTSVIVSVKRLQKALDAIGH